MTKKYKFTRLKITNNGLLEMKKIRKSVSERIIQKMARNNDRERR